MWMPYVELSNNEINFCDFGIQVSLSEYFCDFGIQVSLPNPKYENLITKFESLIKKIDKLEHLNQQSLLENNLLKKRLNNKYDNQQEHIKAIVEIAKQERIALYDDIIKLINERERFCLNNLLNYSLSQWLMMHNLVVVEFIKTLIHNENEDHYKEEKLFKCAIAIDNIYRIRHLKYVSSINLALLAIKYSSKF
ncbi:hypothetical protein F8M41_022714 [Gigaspora margarita]|uniref:Uncharacterized protein n=1 Tax=Gigaspora margarita TaxID=4874 RepID=A0A8H4AEL8_GIGMA|nr:hypothetical protein F8M41_022714 [Gigaspora margarita]